MRWNDFGGMSAEDLRAIDDYLRSVRPVKDAIPDFEPAPG